ncbi:MAG: DUF177 domain-containing protein [Rhodospirillaceae bacterium]|nr:DUF177 domain-containing protein [Rhodospirillaceae bacterium]
MSNDLLIKEEFSRKFQARKIPASGLRVDLVATSEECAALTERLGILSCSSLVAALTLTVSDDGKQVHVDGRIQADVAQACVVSLEPVEQKINEPVSLLFLNESRFEAYEKLALINGDPDDEEIPYPILKGVFDVGAAITECLALELDPYPRRDDAELPPSIQDDVEAEPLPERRNPFAVLQTLHRPDGSDVNGNET